MRYRGISIKNVVESIVPITRFNRGEASKVFEEVGQYGVKVVVKKNVPACVLMKPEQYDAMVEALEDYALYVEARKRDDLAVDERPLSADAVMALLQISSEEMTHAEVDIE